MADQVLIVDDDRRLSAMLAEYLTGNGFRVRAAETAGAGIAEIARLSPDAVVLDVMLPDMDGFEALKRIRANSDVPVLMLTARGDETDRIVGLEIGADDYLPKPFELSVLLARINALLRRRQWFQKDLNKSEAGVVAVGNKTIDFEALELRSQQQTVQLTLMEAELLRYLIGHEGKIVSRSAILEEVWGLREDTDTRAIDNFIVRLRKYLEDEPSRPRHLLTVRGVGYRFVS